MNFVGERYKPLYSGMLEFATEAEQGMKADQADRQFHLRRASWQVVDTIKAMKDMQGNIDRYMLAGNKFIRCEYNTIRRNLAVLLRALFKTEREVGPVRQLAQLKELRAMMEKSDIIANGTLDKLIRKNRISSDIATSLMRDSSYTDDIQRNLIDAAEVIFKAIFSREQDLSLETEDEDHLIKREEIAAG